MSIVRTATVRAALRLPPRHWLAVLRTLAIAVFVESSIRILPLPRLARLMRVPLRLGPETAQEGAARPSWTGRERERLDVAVRFMRHWPWGNTCLRNALVVGNTIRHRDPRLRVGVALVDGEVKAHAWLEVDGASLDSAGSATFAPLDAVNGA